MNLKMPPKGGIFLNSPFEVTTLNQSEAPKMKSLSLSCGDAIVFKLARQLFDKLLQLLKRRLKVHALGLEADIEIGMI